MHVVIVGGRDPRLMELLIGELRNVMEAFGSIFAVALDEYQPRRKDRSLTDIVVQMFVENCRPVDAKTILLPSLVENSFGPRKYFQKMRPTHNVLKTLPRTNLIRFRRRAPHGGLAVLRQEKRMSNPSRKPRRNGSR